MALGLAVDISGTISHSETLQLGNEAKNIQDALDASETFQLAFTRVQQDPSISGAALGEFISESLEFGWSHASRLRTGNAMKRWTTWYKSLPDYDLMTSE